MSTFTEELNTFASEKYEPLFETLDKHSIHAHIIAIDIPVDAEFYKRWRIKHINFVLTVDDSDISMTYLYNGQVIDPVIIGEVPLAMDALMVVRAATEQDTHANNRFDWRWP